MHIYQLLVIIAHCSSLSVCIKNNENNAISDDISSRNRQSIVAFPGEENSSRDAVASRRIRFESEDLNDNYIENNPSQGNTETQRGPNGYVNYPIYSYRPPESQYIRPSFNQNPNQQNYQTQQGQDYYLIDYYNPETPQRPQRPQRPQKPQYNRPQYYQNQFSSPNGQFSSPNGQFSSPNGQFSSSGFQYPYYQSNDVSGPGSNYANQYYYRPQTGPGGGNGGLGSGLGGGLGSGLLSSFGGLGGFGGQNPVGNQFGTAIENIVRYDDYKCVPKIVCQMVGNPNRQSTLPAWLNAPSLTALISAVPSTSPLLVFGRAALLGLSGGELSCDSAYPRCPRNEDDVLHYLNNHRGGFFKFFNGGAAYGDEEDYQYDEQQYRPPGSFQQQGAVSSPSGGGGVDLSSLQNIADAINQGGGINLSNLGSNLGLLGNLASLGSALSQATQPQPVKKTPEPAKPSIPNLNLSNLANLGLLSNLGSQLGLGDTVSNLLTGIVGARFQSRKSRKIKKRSAEIENSTEKGEEWEDMLLSLAEESQSHTKAQSKKRNLNKEIGDDATKLDVAESNHTKKKKYYQDLEKKDKLRQLEKLLGIQERIMNKGIEAEDRIINYPELKVNSIVFPHETLVSQNHVYNLAPSSNFVFPPFNNDIRTPKAVQFAHTTSHEPSNPLQFPENFQNTGGIILDIPKPLPLEYYDRTKMIFPDRTGTGNLRFDNDEILKDPIYSYGDSSRFGRILTGRPSSSSYQNPYDNYGTVTFNRGDVLVFHSYDQTTRKPAFDFGNRYPIYQNQQSSNYNHQPSSSNYQSQSSGQKIYVTNAQGITEYYINERGEKIRV